jgi:surface protein
MLTVIPNGYPDLFTQTWTGQYDNAPLKAGVNTAFNFNLRRIYEWGPWKNDTASGLSNNSTLAWVPNVRPDNNFAGFNNLFNNCINLHYTTDGVPNYNNLAQWKTDDIKDFTLCFYDCNWTNETFGADWDVSSAESLYGMFGRNYNYGDVTISGWDVGNCKDFRFMFQNCNQGPMASLDLSNWNTSSATTMQFMFLNTNVDFDFSSWDFSNLDANGLQGWRANSIVAQGLSVATYDGLLARWVEQAPLMNALTSISVGAGSNYSAAGAANRLILTDTYGWTIQQDGVEV